MHPDERLPGVGLPIVHPSAMIAIVSVTTRKDLETPIPWPPAVGGKLPATNLRICRFQLRGDTSPYPGGFVLTLKESPRD
jgi:hypothetical protein